MEFRSFPLCNNGCCLVCHATYCLPDGHALDLEQARDDYNKGGAAMMLQRAGDKPQKS